MEQTMEMIDALVRLIALVLPVIGVTGGLKGLLSSLPDVTVGPWTISDGLYVSWIVAAVFAVLANVVGYIPAPDTFATPELWIAAQWTLLAGLANYVRRVAYGSTPVEIVGEA